MHAIKIKTSKEIKLESLASNILDNSVECQRLLAVLNLDRKNIVAEYVKYDLDLNDYNNEIYESIENRFVLHLHNLLEGSWHVERQDSIDLFLNSINTRNIVDVGFGVPNKYMKFLLQKKEKRLTLVDLYDSAFVFATALLDIWDKDWKNTISFKKENMNNQSIIGNYDTYIFQDSIEHVNNPTYYLSQQVEAAPLKATFILSIPLGPKIPMHTIAWETEKEALGWLMRCGLNVNKKRLIELNPKVDLFAEQVNFAFKELVVLCYK